jgi:hypothetical protein
MLKEMKKPKKRKEINYSELETVCKQHLDNISSGKYHEDDNDAHYIYEYAMMSIYGKDVFDYINSKL